MAQEEQLQKRMNSLQLISDQVNQAYTAEQIGIVQKNIAKGTSDSELAYFLNVCRTMKLNPFNKEVWCYKDKKNNLLIFAGRDGFLSKAQQNPDFNGIRSVEIRKEDDFSIDVLNNKIHHNISKEFKDRGDIIYGVAIVFRKDGEPTIELADFKHYNKGYNTWQTHPAEMIKKVAEAHALKKAFGISGIQTEYDYSENNGQVEPITTESKEFLSEEEITNGIEKAETYDDLFNIWQKLTEEQQSEYGNIVESKKDEIYGLQ